MYKHGFLKSLRLKEKKGLNGYKITYSSQPFKKLWALKSQKFLVVKSIVVFICLQWVKKYILWVFGQNIVWKTRSSPWICGTIKNIGGFSITLKRVIVIKVLWICVDYSMKFQVFKIKRVNWLTVWNWRRLEKTWYLFVKSWQSLPCWVKK